MASVEKKEPLWVPNPQSISGTNAAKFISYINQKHGLALQTYQELHRWSTAKASIQTFWEDAFTWLELPPPDSQHVHRMLGDSSSPTGGMFPPAKFFPTSFLNIAENILRGRADSVVAIHFAREGVSGIEPVTWKAFREHIRAIRSAMVNSGVVKNDVVAAVISNSVDAMAICLAALSLGAVWSSSSCDLGTTGIIDRYRQISPKLVFADDGYTYAGKTIKLGDRIVDWSHRLDCDQTLKNVVLVPYCNVPVAFEEIHRGCTMQSFLQRDTGEQLDFKLVPFSHPAFILFSSGTTGKPKCIVHSTGGAALKIKTDYTLQHDVRRTDTVFQYTTTSWVMWVLNLLNLSCASSMLLYDGSPFHPRPTILLELAEKTKVGVFGTSPRYLTELRDHGIIPYKSFNLSNLRVVTSTGSILSEDIYRWFYSKAFPPSVLLCSMSGGTDIAGCFVGGTPLLPVYAGEIQCKALGMAVDIFDATRPDPVSLGNNAEPGELVCTEPFPSQPLAFLGEDGNERYRSSYFERYGTTIWCQGDLVKQIPDTGGLVMLGRSDGVLNPSGVRFGSAEIYAVTETFPELSDSLCVGQKRDFDADERVLLFIKMKSGSRLDTDLAKRIRGAIRDRYSPRHVPKFIFEVADIPYTVNGKKCEINVKNIVNGRKSVASGTIINPGALDLYEKYWQLPKEGQEASHGSKDYDPKL